MRMTRALKDILALGIEQFKSASEEDKNERELIDEDLKFAVDYEGKSQWPSEIREARENDNPPRPCLVVNKIPEKIDQVEGEFKQLEPSVKVVPVDSAADPKTAQIRGGLIKHIEYQSTARSAYNHAHTHVLYAGRGAWEIGIEQDLDDPFVSNIVISRIPNILNVYYDQTYKKHDRSDANYFFITEMVREKEYKRRFKTKDLSSFEVGKSTPDNWHKSGMLRIAKYWWKDEKEVMFFRVRRQTDDGQVIELTVKEKGLREDDEIQDSKKVKVPWVRWGIITHDRFLKGPVDDWPSQYIPIIVESGKEINISGQQVSRGMTRHAKGPQRMYNYWTSSGTEMLALSPKSPYLVTSKMINKQKDQWDNAHLKNYFYLIYDPDPNAPGASPRREPPPMLSTAYTTELARTEHDIMSAMGIYQAGLGDAGDEKSGKAIRERKMQGSIGSFSYTDSFKHALIYSTKIVNDLIPSVYDSERVVRILGDDGTEKSVPINAVEGGVAMREAGPDVSEDLLTRRPEVSKYVNDMTVGKYDIRITLGPSYTTQRQEAVAILMDLIAAIPQIGLATADIIIRNIDVPGVEELVNRVKKLMPPEAVDEPGEDGQPPGQSQGPPPIDPKIMIEMQKLELQIQEGLRKEFEAQIKAIKDLSDAESNEIGAQLGELTQLMKMIRGSIGQQEQ